MWTNPSLAVLETIPNRDSASFVLRNCCAEESYVAESRMFLEGTE
jgi:hypothetical protein